MADRTCCTCAFGGTPSYKTPCSSCHPTYEGRTNWTEKQKKQTNADKFFRNATDEQIARFLAASQAEFLEVFARSWDIRKPIITPKIIQVDELEETERGDGGFGSTGAYASEEEFETAVQRNLARLYEEQERRKAAEGVNDGKV